MRAAIVRIMLYTALSLGPMSDADFGHALAPHPYVETVEGPPPGIAELVASVFSVR